MYNMILKQVPIPILSINQSCLNNIIRSIKYLKCNKFHKKSCYNVSINKIILNVLLNQYSN